MKKQLFLLSLITFGFSLRSMEDNDVINKFLASLSEVQDVENVDADSTIIAELNERKRMMITALSKNNLQQPCVKKKQKRQGSFHEKN